MKVDCESVDIVVEYDDKGFIIRIDVETKEDPESLDDSGLQGT